VENGGAATDREEKYDNDDGDFCLEKCSFIWLKPFVFAYLEKKREVKKAPFLH